MKHTLIQYGYPTPNPPGKERRQENKEQDNLQLQAHTGAGGLERKRCRIIYFENASNVNKPFTLQEVGTVAEVEQAIYDRFPDFSTEHVGIRMYGHQLGIQGRTCFTDRIPYETDTLYLRLYLKKHPRISSQ
jgi:hypothetical protein